MMFIIVRSHVHVRAVSLHVSNIMLSEQCPYNLYLFLVDHILLDSCIFHSSKTI